MASSSATPVIPQNKYDVFISFRGEDTRDNFTSHLYAALCRKHIETFIDNQLITGDEISQSLLKAIEESYISVIIFSERYASSGWCLDELVKILECKNKYGQVVMPVFYRVDPSDVRNQSGNFGDSFSKLEERFQGRLDKLQKWRIALREAASLSGFHSHVYRSESELIKNIANEILKRMENLFSSDNKDQLIGVESRILEIESLLDIGSKNVYKLGIWGIGGIGKTTIATAVFNKISSYFEGSCFLHNVREESEKVGGLAQLQSKLLSTLLNEENPKINSFNIRRLSRKKVLIVFDDVTHLEQVENSIGSLHYFGAGSRIIITTRDRNVLEVCRVDEIYKVNELVQDDALKLFSRHAFGKNYPNEGYEQLSCKVIKYARAVPLALKVLGCFLLKRSEEEWVSEINKLKEMPHMDIQKVLKVSYDSLDDKAKNVFLDIACFFKGEDEDLVTKFLDASGFYAKIGIRVLIDKCLITISRNKITMHDLLQEMGREIVRQESVKYPGKRSRLWHHEDIYQVFKHNTVTEAIEGISLDMSKIKSICLQPDCFKKMYRLRFLKLYGSYINRVHIQDIEPILMELSYLHWPGYPLKSLPIHPEKLVSLVMFDTKVEQLWDGVQNLVNLKEIRLSGSRQLTKLPDLSKAQNLENLTLKHCSSLVGIHSSIQYLNKLVKLDLQDCKSLTSLPRRIPSEFLKQLFLNGCSNLKRLPDFSSCNLEEFSLRESAIEELPPSIECLSRLKWLDLRNCSRLERLPSSLFNLESLVILNISGCSNLKCLPEISSCNLVRLHLDGSAIEELPSSIECLSRLKCLDLSNCSRLERLPNGLFNLESLVSLIISDCSNLKWLPEITSCNLEEFSLGGSAIEEQPPYIECLSRLKWLDLRNCSRLERLPSSLFNLESLKILNISGCSNLKWLPEISSIECLSRLDELDLTNCTWLQSLPISLCKMKSLQRLILSGCSNLQRLPDELGNLDALKTLEVERTAISELPLSMVSLKNLVSLHLENLRGHEQMNFILPPILLSSEGLHNLESLSLIDCGITELPESLGQLSSLRYLYLDKNNFERIPKSVINLSKLEILHLNYCERLQSLPNLPRSLRHMDANHCSSLEALSGLSSLFTIQGFDQRISLRNCLKLDADELKEIVDNALHKIQRVATTWQKKLYLEDKNRCSGICYPGREIHEWFKYQSMGSFLAIELPPGDRFNNEFVGFAYCVIVSFKDHHQSDKDFHLCCELKLKTEDGECIVARDFLYGQIGYGEADHVILGKVLFSRSTYDRFEKYYNNVTIFEFYLMDGTYKGKKFCEVVKKCGIHLLWAQDYGESKKDGNKSFSSCEEEEPPAQRLKHTRSSF